MNKHKLALLLQIIFHAQESQHNRLTFTLSQNWGKKNSFEMKIFYLNYDADKLSIQKFVRYFQSRYLSVVLQCPRTMCTSRHRVLAYRVVCRNSNGTRLFSVPTEIYRHGSASTVWKPSVAYKCTAILSSSRALFFMRISEHFIREFSLIL